MVLDFLCHFLAFHFRLSAQSLSLLTEHYISTQICPGARSDLLTKDSFTPQLAARRSANFLQIQLRFTSDSL
ncbi:hypothetical protein ACN38_g12230 [Penicillium nordicum]|uniref:Secreted protein n=1 Tax=Penicillium nordicum TaxID=229535 RepID=A0A0M8NPY7_9EURO|nr:hypothetical protein ACN38_g12230 [Penicillium nordicum]